MNSSPETEYWLICPVCNKPNPAGTRFCQHCWGAALGSQKPLSTQELEGVIERRQARIRRRKRAVRITLALVSVFVVAGIVLPVLYNYTDLIFPPLETINSNSLPNEWAMFRHDLFNSGTTGATNTSPQPKIKWTFATGGIIHSSAAVANGTVYFGSRDGQLYAVDAATGNKRWEFPTGSWVESTPAIVNGTVYFGSNDGAMYAVDAETGQMVWKFHTRYRVVSSPAVADGMVFFGADDYGVYALDALTGTLLWRVETVGWVMSSPAVSEGLVFVGSSGRYVYVIHAQNGQVRLRFKTISPVFSAPAVMGRTGLFVSFDGYVHAIDGNAHNWPWEYGIRAYWIQLWAFGLPLPAPPAPSGLLWQLRVGRVVRSSPVIAGDVLPIGGNVLYIGADNNLVAIYLQTRKWLWSFPTGGAVQSSPAVAGDTVYVGSEDGYLYAVDAVSGKKLWQFATGGKITSSPTVADDTVYIGSHDGKMYAIN